MSWSGTADDRSGGRRKRGRRGPRWVTDRAREIADAPPLPRRHVVDPPRRAAAPRYDGRWDDEYGPGHDEQRRHDDQRPRYGDDPRNREEQRNPDEPRHRDEPRYGARDRDEPPPRSWQPPADTGPRGRRTTDRGATDRGATDRGATDRGATDREATNRRTTGRGHDDRGYYPWDEDPDYRPRREPGRGEYGGGQDRGPRPGRPTPAHEPPNTRASTGEHAGNGGDGGSGPRKLTVTRVAAWRSRQLAQLGIAAFRRAATADGADRSGLTALTFPVMASNAADAALAVALANTLFFSAATAESKTKVALYLLITVAPFALLAPVIGPMLDRLQRGRRVALAASFVGRALLAIVMAQHFNDWLLYPAALGFMVLTRSFGLLKAAVTPRVLPPGMTLTRTNSRLAVFGLAAGGVVGAAAAGFALAFGSAGALLFTAAVCLVGVWLCLRIPAWVEVTEGEVAASLLDHGDEQPRSGRRREPLSQHVVVALWGNGTIRILTGFLTLFVAFAVKAHTEHSPWKQLVLLGMVGAAAGAGNITGNALGARRHFVKPDQVILTCVGIVLGAALLAALMGDIATAVLVGLVGSTCSSLAKVCQDAVIQHDMSEESRASAFGRTETILQLSWTFGGALGLLLPPVYWLGFTVISALLLVGTIQTAMAHRGSSLIRPLSTIRLRGVRPRGARRRRASTGNGNRPGGHPVHAREPGQPTQPGQPPIQPPQWEGR